MFLAGCVFGALACFARADCNLPLYAFLYIMWDQDDVSNRFANLNPPLLALEQQAQVDAFARNHIRR